MVQRTTNLGFFGSCAHVVQGHFYQASSVVVIQERNIIQLFAGWNVSIMQMCVQGSAFDDASGFALNLLGFRSLETSRHSQRGGYVFSI